MKTRSQGSSIPEEIPEEYVNDTFESLDSTATPAHSTPLRSDLSLKRDTSPAVSRRSSTGEGSKSEEEASMTGELLPKTKRRIRPTIYFKRNHWWLDFVQHYSTDNRGP